MNCKLTITFVICACLSFSMSQVAQADASSDSNNDGLIATVKLLKEEIKLLKSKEKIVRASSPAITFTQTPGSASKPVVATCLNEYIVTGGGCHSYHAGLAVYSSMPTENGYSCEFINWSKKHVENAPVRAVAICLKSPK